MAVSRIDLLLWALLDIDDDDEDEREADWDDWHYIDQDGDFDLV